MAPESASDAQNVSWGKKLPPILLLHGNADKCAPIGNAERFAAALREGGAAVELKTYEGQTHTSPLIENPMRGGRDLLQASALVIMPQSLMLLSHRLLVYWVHQHCAQHIALCKGSITQPYTFMAS